MIHPDDGTIERFVMGALDDDTDFVQHVAGCDDCSRRLQREASAELAVYDVQARVGTLPRVAEAAAPTMPVVRSSLARRVLGPALVLAAAAALMVWVGHERHLQGVRAEAASAARVVACPDGPEQLDCIAEAHRSGARLEYPAGTPLASLGSEPGLSVLVEPRSSDGNLAGMDDLVQKATSELRTCVAGSLVTQDAPTLTGDVAINFAVGSDGRIQQLQKVIQLRTSSAKRGRSPDAEHDPAIGVARCLAKAVEAFPFRGEDRVVRVTLGAKYIWRE